MLRMKWLMVTLSGTLLFTSPTSNLKPFQATEQSIENEIDLNGVVQVNEIGMVKHPIQVQYEKKKLENEKKAEEERLRKEKELEEQKKNEPEWQEFVLTFYTSLNSENGYGSITCTGSKLYDGLVASNYYKLNTKIQLQGWGEVIVGDRGGSNFNNDFRLDVFVPKESNESDSHYYSRVNNMGKVKVKGYIVK